MSTNKIVKLVLAATTGGLMLAAASGASFAAPSKPVYPPIKQPPAKAQPAKPISGPSHGKNIRPQ
jgi:ABC-type oligopeptide transport system substrate-binding subunit